MIHGQNRFDRGSMDALLTSQISGAPFEDQSDEALAARALHDPEAFTLLYRAYALDVYRYCYRRLQDRDFAEDATSQTFINAYAGLRRLGHKPFRPWLFAIAHNVVVDVHRNRRRFSALCDVDSREDPDPSPETLAIDREQRDAMQRLLRQLSKRDREVVELRLAGLTGREIAQTLDCSPDAVRAAQYRAMHRLRELWDKEGIGER
jgi:RNA polymerase sigma-70 factor (ECF subfamily)